MSVEWTMALVGAAVFGLSVLFERDMSWWSRAHLHHSAGIPHAAAARLLHDRAKIRRHG